MTTRLFSTFEKIVAPSVPGCPQPTIVQYVREAAREVCERTNTYRYEHDSIPLTSGEYSYTFETPNSTEVCLITHATVDNAEVEVINLDNLHRRYPDWPQTASAKRSTPQVLSMIEPSEIVIAPVPDRPTSTTSYMLKMFVTLRPTVDATYMDKGVLDSIERLVVHGALQRLLVMPNKSWMDRQLATYHAKQFLYKIADRRANINLGVGRDSLRVRAEPWA